MSEVIEHRPLRPIDATGCCQIRSQLLLLWSVCQSGWLRQMNNSPDGRQKIRSNTTSETSDHNTQVTTRRYCYNQGYARYASPRHARPKPPQHRRLSVLWLRRKTLLSASRIRSGSCMSRYISYMVTPDTMDTDNWPGQRGSRSPASRL